MLWGAGQFPNPRPRLSPHWTRSISPGAGLSPLYASLYLFLTILQMGQLGLREVRTPALSHTASKEQNQDCSSDPADLQAQAPHPRLTPRCQRFAGAPSSSPRQPFKDGPVSFTIPVPRGWGPGQWLRHLTGG